MLVEFRYFTGALKPARMLDGSPKRAIQLPAFPREEFRNTSKINVAAKCQSFLVNEDYWEINAIRTLGVAERYQLSSVFHKEYEGDFANQGCRSGQSASIKQPTIWVSFSGRNMGSQLNSHSTCGRHTFLPVEQVTVIEYEFFCVQSGWNSHFYWFFTTGMKCVRFSMQYFSIFKFMNGLIMETISVPNRPYEIDISSACPQVKSASE